MGIKIHRRCLSAISTGNLLCFKQKQRKERTFRRRDGLVVSQEYFVQNSKLVRRGLNDVQRIHAPMTDRLSGVRC
jgi:hypothetical protein